MCSETSIVLHEKEELVKVISTEQLEKINSKLGSSFTTVDESFSNTPY